MALYFIGTSVIDAVSGSFKRYWLEARQIKVSALAEAERASGENAARLNLSMCVSGSHYHWIFK